MLPGDPLNRVLYIDLSRLSYSVEERPDLFEAHASLGMRIGKGVKRHLGKQEVAGGQRVQFPDDSVLLIRRQDLRWKRRDSLLDVPLRVAKVLLTLSVEVVASRLL